MYHGSFTSDANATADDLLRGSLAYVNGQPIYGNIYSRGAIAYTPSTSNVNISVGYHNGSYIKAIPTQTRTVTPTTSQQVITPDTGNYLTQVTVNAISTQVKTVTPTTSLQQITPDSGRYLSRVNVRAVNSSIDANIVSGNIKNGVEILGIIGNYEGSSGVNIYNSVNEMVSDLSAVTNLYGIVQTNVIYTPQVYNASINENVGFSCLDIVSSFTTKEPVTSTASKKFIDSNLSDPYGIDFYFSEISLSNNSAMINITNGTDPTYLTVEYSSSDGITYNISNLSGTALYDNKFFYLQNANIEMGNFKGDFLPNYVTTFDDFFKPMIKSESLTPIVSGLYQYDGTNWNSLLERY